MKKLEGKESDDEDEDEDDEDDDGGGGRINGREMEERERRRRGEMRWGRRRKSTDERALTWSLVLESRRLCHDRRG